MKMLCETLSLLAPPPAYSAQNSAYTAVKILLFESMLYPSSRLFL